MSAAGLVLLAPATAHAYEAEDYTTSISSPSIPAGGSFTVVTQGPEGNPEITLTLTSNPASIPSSSIVIAGTKSLRKATDAGVAEFTVTLSEPGKYTVVPTDVDGVVLTTQTVTVLGEDGSESDDDDLASTGFATRNVALAAGGLVMLGAGLAGGVYVARSRKS